MFDHLTMTHFLIGGFASALVLIFGFAAFLDDRWRKAARRRDFRRAHVLHLSEESLGRDYEDDTSYLQTDTADLSASGLGTLGQRITFRDKTMLDLEEDLDLPVLRAN